MEGEVFLFKEELEEELIEASLLDKKVSGGKVRWVLLERLGKAVLRDGVPDDVVRRAVAAVVAE